MPYYVFGADSDVDAYNALFNYAPLIFVNLIVKTRHLGERIDSTTWEGEVTYGVPEASEGDGVDYTFDTGGGTAHLTQSLETLGSYAAPGYSAPDFGGAIGVTPDGVNGVDVAVPVYHFSETHRFPPSAVTEDYKNTLADLTGCQNSTTFRGRERGEVHFEGAAGSQRGQEDYEIAFKFAVSPNATNLTVGPVTGIDKGGWDYLWVRYIDKEDASSKSLIKYPAAVYVERVKEFAEFAGLGIG
ncbi:hypothetical protein [Symmachiella macrocystis]|uniref:hypothetical protein n=1 Tax=Symmachiella macrocystis TaxID=2527985 RepID=UPI0011B596A2|nr:hypothetical protein [Symmachiella macrocystis]